MNKLKKNETKMIKKMMFKLRKSNAVVKCMQNIKDFQFHIISNSYHTISIF